MIITTRSRQILFSTIISLFLVSNIFLFGPYNLYTSNINEFVVPLFTILGLYVGIVAFIVMLFAVIGYCLPAGLYSRYIVILCSISILLWLQGNIFVWDYGIFDGNSINWEIGGWRGWVDASIWILVLVVSTIKHQSLRAPLLNLTAFLFFIQLIGISATWSRYEDLMSDKALKLESASSLKDIQNFSPEKNVLHIVLDGFQSDIFQRIINDKSFDDYYDRLDGFTFYRGNSGLWSSTYMTIPAIVSGKIYFNHMPKPDFVTQVFRGDNILNLAFNKGYDVDLVSDKFEVNMYNRGHYTNSYAIPNNLHIKKESIELDDSIRLLDISLFRYAPHFVKKYIYSDQLWLLQQFLINREYQQYRYFSHNAFLKSLAENIRNDRQKPVYKLFHLMTTHAPFVVNENCTYAGQTLERNVDNVSFQARCSLDTVISLLEEMKRIGIYDSSLIIIMADHGAGLDLRQNKPADDDPNRIHPYIISMALSLMAIKPPNSRGTLQLSDAQSSLADTAATINSILGLGGDFDGRSITGIDENAVIDRRFYYYAWQRDDWESDYTGPIQEFKINGSVFDDKSWQAGKVYLPKDSDRQ